MSKITFLFGAGASRNCLPIVNEIPNRLYNLIDILKKDELQLEHEEFKPANKSYRELQIELIEDIKWLFELSNNHASVDTAAKKLFIKGDYNNLLRLKVALSIFLIVEQILKSPDKRYDSFFSSILGESKSDFPKNIRVVSWNYDLQFELSFMDYINDKRLDALRSHINFITKFDYLRDNDDIQNFGIFKLNGHAGFYTNSSRWSVQDLLPSLDGDLDTTKFKSLINNYARLKYNLDGLNPSLSFAWEDQYGENNVVKKAISNVFDTEILVVIGYSFPFFNRNIDRRIIQSMTNLKKIYLQSPEAMALKDRLNAVINLEKIEVVPIKDTEQFILPYEL